MGGGFSTLLIFVKSLSKLLFWGGLHWTGETIGLDWTRWTSRNQKLPSLRVLISIQSTS